MLLVLNSTGRKLNIRQMLRVKAPLKMKRNWKNKKKQNLEMTFKPYSAKTIILFLHLGRSFIHVSDRGISDLTCWFLTETLDSEAHISIGRIACERPVSKLCCRLIPPSLWLIDPCFLSHIQSFYLMSRKINSEQILLQQPCTSQATSLHDPPKSQFTTTTIPQSSLPMAFRIIFER